MARPTRARAAWTNHRLQRHANRDPPLPPDVPPHCRAHEPSEHLVTWFYSFRAKVVAAIDRLHRAFIECRKPVGRAFCPLHEAGELPARQGRRAILGARQCIVDDSILKRGERDVGPATLGGKRLRHAVIARVVGINGSIAIPPRCKLQMPLCNTFVAIGRTLLDTRGLAHAVSVPVSAARGICA